MEKLVNTAFVDFCINCRRSNVPQGFVENVKFVLRKFYRLSFTFSLTCFSLDSFSINERIIKKYTLTNKLLFDVFKINKILFYFPFGMGHRRFLLTINISQCHWSSKTVKYFIQCLNFIFPTKFL